MLHLIPVRKAQEEWFGHVIREVGVARFIDASIYHDTFPAIHIAILFFTITNFFVYFFVYFFFHNDFDLGRKET